MNLPLLVLLCVTSCSAHTGVRAALRVAAGSQSATLQSWLVGLTAVVGFLFMVFIFLIFRRLLRENRDDEEEEGRDNKALEPDDGGSKQTSL